jgi:N-methylhydantoinase A
MSLRITAVGAVDKTGLYEKSAGTADPAKAVKGKRKAHFEELGGMSEVPVYNRDLLVPGARIPGPAIIEERITTIVVHPGWNARVDGFENVVMETEART